MLTTVCNANDVVGGDRLLNLGWVIKERHGALTVPRELRWEPATFGLLANPVEELASLRNGTISAEANITLTDGSAQLLQGTEGGQAISADVELAWVLPPATASSSTFGARFLSAPAKQPRPANSMAVGVTVTVSVAAAASDGSRVAVLTIFDCGSLASTGRLEASRNECGTQASAARHHFTVLAGEHLLSMRVLVDRTIVEAFVQGGRVAYTKVHTPADWRYTGVYLLSSNGSAVCAAANVWSMGCGWVGADEE